MSPALRRRISALRRRTTLGLRLSRTAITGTDLPSRSSARSSASSSSVQGAKLGGGAWWAFLENTPARRGWAIVGRAHFEGAVLPSTTAALAGSMAPLKDARIAESK